MASGLDQTDAVTLASETLQEGDGGGNGGPPPTNLGQFIPQDYQIIYDLTVLLFDFLASDWYDFLKDLINVITDIVNLIELAFQGRPRAEATLQVAKRLMAQRNPMAGIAGAGILRLVNEFDIVISSSVPGEQRWFDNVFEQLRVNLTNLGLTAAQIVEVIDDIRLHSDDPTKPLLHGAGDKLSADYKVYGTQHYLADWSWRENLYELRGYKPQRAARLATNYMLLHGYFKEALYIQISKQTPTSVIPFQKPPTIPLPPDICQGYINQLSTDNAEIATLQGQITALQNQIAQLEQQLASQPPPPDCQPYIDQIATLNAQIARLNTQLSNGNTIITNLTNQITLLQAQITALEAGQGQGGGDGGGDGVSDCCANIVAALTAIAANLTALAQTTPAQVDTGCCDKVVAQIKSAQQQIAAAIANAAAAQPEPAPVDLSEIIATLKDLDACICAALKTIAATFDPAQYANLPPIPTIAPLVLAPSPRMRAYLAYLEQNGLVDPGLAQLLTT